MVIPYRLPWFFPSVYCYIQVHYFVGTFFTLLSGLVLAVGDNYLFSGSWDKTIRVWDLNTLECIKELEGHTEAVLALAVGNGQLVSGSYDTTVRFWDLRDFRCVRKCDGHDDAVRVLAATDGKVFSGSYDGTIGVW